MLVGLTLSFSALLRIAPLIVTHKAKYIQTESGLLSLCAGPFVAALEHATAETAETTVVG